MAEHGLTRRLGRDLLRQAVLISVAVFISMFAAGLMIEDVLIEQALESDRGPDGDDEDEVNVGSE